MPARVKVRAVIWIDDQIAVHRTERRGHQHVTLPGGRVNERESVTAALHREVREELGSRSSSGTWSSQRRFTAAPGARMSSWCSTRACATSVTGRDSSSWDPTDPKVES